MCQRECRIQREGTPKGRARMPKRDRHQKKPFASMLAAVLSWHAVGGGGASASGREKFVDEKLAELIDEDRMRALQVKNNKIVGPPPHGSEEDLRANDVVSDEVAHRLAEARKVDVPIMANYFRRAAAVPPHVDLLETTLAGVNYNIPRVTLLEPATHEELAAMSKLYPTKAMFVHKDSEGVKRGLKERTQPSPTQPNPTPPNPITQPNPIQSNPTKGETKIDIENRWFTPEWRY